MKRRNIVMLTGICIGLSIVMMACHTKDPGTILDTTAPTSTSVEQTTENPTVPALKLPKEEQAQVLKDKLSSAAEGELVQFVCLDYDADGAFEAFALMGSKDTQAEDTYNATLWFASDAQVTPIGESSSYSYLERISTGDTYLMLVSKNMTGGSQNYIYGVKDGQPYEDEASRKFSGLLQAPDGSFTAIQDAYDACTDGTGHTWKSYWFYYDNGFHEYGAAELSQEQFKTYKGADKILAQIESEKGKIVDILYRENGIININYQTPWSRDGVDDYINNNFLNLQYKDSEVTLINTDDNRGQYLKALMPEIAIFPAE